MREGALIDAMEYSIKCQDETIKTMENRVDICETALQLIVDLPLGGNILRYIEEIKQIANEVLIEVESEEFEAVDRTVRG